MPASQYDDMMLDEVVLSDVPFPSLLAPKWANIATNSHFHEIPIVRMMKREMRPKCRFYLSNFNMASVSNRGVTGLTRTSVRFPPWP